jgi:hypothetical protein
MASRIEICNLALGWIGEAPIADMDENRPPARYCRLYYPGALEDVLREHPWNFAQARERLAPVDVPEGWGMAYRHAYARPARCVALHFLVGEDGRTNEHFRHTDDGAATMILANIPRAFAQFTRLVEDTETYDSKFVQTLARRLQCLLVGALLKRNASAVQEAETLYRKVLAEAMTADAREGARFQDARALWNGGHDLWGDVVRRECG